MPIPDAVGITISTALMATTIVASAAWVLRIRPAPVGKALLPNLA
jgi:hypothetical protein